MIGRSCEDKISIYKYYLIVFNKRSLCYLKNFVKSIDYYVNILLIFGSIIEF